MKELYSKGVLTGVLFILFIGSLVFNYHFYRQQKDTQRKNDEFEIVVKTNNILIDSLQKQINARNTKLAQVLADKEAGKEIEKQVVIKYQTIYQQIQTATDTAEVSIMFSLLNQYNKK